MDTVQTLKRTEYEWFLSGDKITQESLYADFQESGKIVDTPSLPFNWNTTNKLFSSLMIFANLFLHTKYDIANTAEDNLEIFIAKNISKVSKVEYILITKTDKYYEIWTVINKLNKEVRDRIYDIEYNLLEHFRDYYFDFHVLCRDDRNIKDICPINSIMFYRKKV